MTSAGTKVNAVTRAFRNRLVLAASMLAGITIFAVSPARAVELKVLDGVDPALTIVEIKGKIEPGDGQRVITFLGQLPRTRPIAVNLVSPGGNVIAGLEMGRFFHANRIATFVRGPGAMCASACALAFLGGRAPNGEAYRVKGAQARLGYHAFNAFAVADREFTVDDMKKAMQFSQDLLLSITDYMVDVGADIEFMSLMLGTPTTDINFITNEKALAIGLYVLDEKTGTLTPPASKSAASVRTR